MLKFSEKGLLPAIAQDANSGEVLMLAFMDEEALRRTLSTGQAWFYSRSRKELWHKGATSGSYLNVKTVFIDCDYDTILLKVEPTGPVCHTGQRTCFFRELGPEQLEGLLERGKRREGPEILEELFQVVEERRITKPEGSYVASLLGQGIDRIGKKVVEESAETIIAAKNADLPRLAAEVADLLFHTLVLMAASGLSPKDVWQELRRRRG